MPYRRMFTTPNTHAYWDVSSWCPPEPMVKDPRRINLAIRLDFLENGIDCLEKIEAFDDSKIFSDDMIERCYNEAGIIVHRAGYHKSAKVNRMLMFIALRALTLNDERRRSGLNIVVFTTISEHTAMITRALLSFRQRDFNVLFAMPYNSAPDGFGVSLSKDTHCNVSLALLSHPALKIPVWFRQDLFNEDKVIPHLGKDIYAEEDEMEDEDEDENEMEDEMEEGEGEGFQESLAMATTNGTCVFWDVQDYPVPLGLEPDTFIQNIKTALRNIKTALRKEEEKALGKIQTDEEESEVLILAYVGDEKPLPPSYHDHSRIRITSVSAEKYERRIVMMLDFVFWKLDNPQQYPLCPNMLVISKEEVQNSNDRKKTFFWPILRGLKYRGYNLFLAVPDTVLPTGVPRDFIRLVLPWKTLSDKRKRKGREDTVSGSDDD